MPQPLSNRHEWEKVWYNNSMKWRITDKLILLGACAISTYMMTFGFTKGPYIIWILLALAIMLLGEIRKDTLTAYLIAAALLGSAFLFPELLTAAPLSVYTLFVTGPGKIRREYYLRGIVPLAFIAEQILFIETSPERIVMPLITILAVYPAVKTFYHENKEKLLRDSYDNAREDSLNAKRLGEEIIKNADNEVYLATLKERNRIAREIHDNVGHMITRVIVQVQALRIINKDPKLTEQLDSVGETLDLAMTGIRKSVHELHDDSIDVSIAIREIASTLPERFDTEVSTSIDSPADNMTKSVIVGIIKEAVTNISKYSKGTKVRIEVIENNSFWKVRIWDNGKNPDRECLLTGEYFSSEGLGLTNIAARAKSLGGRATLLSNARGFEIIAVLPKTEVKRQ